MSLEIQAALVLPSLALDVHLRLAPGELVALVGPSGAGKSTCLALAAGLLRPDRGRITLGERVLCDTALGIDLPPQQRRLGLVFQDYALFPHLDVRGNVLFGAPRGREAEALRWLDRLGMAEVARARVGQLSGGQRQRVALARALGAEPEALLLDEPLAALDPVTRARVRAELRAFVAGSGRPALVVSHDPVDAVTLGARLVVLEAGRVTQEGTRDELLRHPRTAFVGELAGLNLYRVDLPAGSGLKTARAGAVDFHVLADDLAGEASLAFAPAEVVLAAARPAGSAQNVFAGTVSELLPLPDRVRVLLDVGVPLLSDVTREAVAALDLQPGRRVWASVKATALRVYP